MAVAIEPIEKELAPSLSDADRVRLARGLRQAARLWREEDGDQKAFADFARRHFMTSGEKLDVMFARCEGLFEQLGGHMSEIERNFRVQVDEDRGEVLPIDEIFAGYSVDAHVIDDLFTNKLAFAVLLNFPLTTLDERLQQGASWSRRQWAEARLTARFGKRVPGDVLLKVARIDSAAGLYVSTYNIWMHHLVDARGQRLFPAKLRLLSHWNLRDQLKADYDTPGGLARQRLIYQVMDRIVTQTIPAAVIDNPGVDWDVAANKVRVAAVQDGPAKALAAPLGDAAEPDTRYATWLSTFRGARLIDPHSPLEPTLIARRFNENREIPEARAREMLEQVVASPLVPRVAAQIRARLERPLEPFDIWYKGFRDSGPQDEAALDAIVKRRYPTAAAFAADIPRILTRLGFAPERARAIAALIAVDPARGSGHAMEAAMRGVKVRLRTRVGPDGMNYKGYNIAMHELGHNVEQVISMNDVDHTLLAGVPNTAFTEALAFVFQARDLELLDAAKPPAAQDAAARVLNDFWMTYEIAGVSLLDMEVWRWLYAHPEATPAELKMAVLQIAKELWNRYYAPYLGARDIPLLAIYSHTLDLSLYLPDYPIGHLIAFQIEEHLQKAGAIGPECERMFRMGNVAPDLWMKNATGAPVGTEALLTATERALKELEGCKR